MDAPVTELLAYLGRGTRIGRSQGVCLSPGLILDLDGESVAPSHLGVPMGSSRLCSWPCRGMEARRMERDLETRNSMLMAAHNAHTLKVKCVTTPILP